IGEGDQVDVGSAALALLAYVEILETSDAPELVEPAASLASFLRAQQRPDGEFMHLYSLREKRAIDVQYDYYTGEAALALSRYHRLSKSPRDLDAARRALSVLVKRNPLYVGGRYF